ncbi:MAG: hypothetical protein IJW24_02500 [Clostridia bacterium]|nr:hypothetical protein [Clostridia bacterium]
MVRIWAKIMTENKLQKDIIYEAAGIYNPAEFYLHVQEICHKMDIPSPVVLKTHVHNYTVFNTCLFLSRDFVESVSFEKLILENAQE